MEKPDATAQPGVNESKPRRAGDKKAAGTVYRGTEPFFAFFTQAQVTISGLRMTFDEQVAQPASDIASAIEGIRRKFLHDGDLVAAIEKVRKATTALDKRISAWESEAQRRENNKTKMSGENIQKMKAEFTRVRMKSGLARRTLTKLLIELQQMANGGVDIDTAATAGKRKQPSAEEIAASRKKRAKCIEIVVPIVSKLIHNELTLNAGSARFESGTYPAGHEEAWDPGLPAFLAAGWYAAQRSHKSGNDLDLDVWLIPKEPVVAAALSILAPELDVSLHAPGEPPRTLKFFALSAMTDVIPRSAQLRTFVTMIEENNFASASKGLKVLRAKIPFAARRDSFQRLVFKPPR